MRHEESHPSDQELATAANGEMSAPRPAAVREHLASCRLCRARMNQIEAAILDFAHLHGSELDPKLPSISGPRALLRARLSALAAQSERSFGARALGFTRTLRSYQLACAALLCGLVVALALGFEPLVSRGGSRLRRLEIASVPKPQLTPGATIPVTRQQICGSSSSTQGPLVPPSLQQQVFRTYGITNPRPGAYEIDYLITPDLGGAANIRNLWPQPYYDTAWNARVKDQLEEQLHAMVCKGQIDVATAQHDLAVDWISAYKKYFHTERPHLRHPKAQQLDLQEGGSPAEDSWQVAAQAVPVNARSIIWFVRRVRLRPSTATEM